jgi:hypothetical protein
MTTSGGAAGGRGEPFIDEHRRAVDKPVAEVWEALVGVVAHDAAPLRRLGALLLGARPSTASGEGLAAGSTVPGFVVARARPPELLVLQGTHRFSSYTLVFRLDPTPYGTSIAAVSAARFPGVTGRLYRALVVGSRLHRLAVRSLLRRIAIRSPGPGGAQPGSSSWPAGCKPK